MEKCGSKCYTGFPHKYMNRICTYTILHLKDCAKPTQNNNNARFAYVNAKKIKIYIRNTYYNNREYRLFII